MTSKFDFRPLLELMGLMLAGMFLSALLNELIFTSITESSSLHKPLDFLGAVALTLICSFGLPAFFWLKYRGALVHDSLPKSMQLKSYITAFLLFIALVFVGDYVMNWASQFLALRGWSELTEEPFNLKSVRDLLLHENLFPLVLLVVAFIPAVVEEFFFRRIIFSYLHKTSRGFWSPAVLSALFFAGMHNHFLSFLPIFLLGLALAFAYYTTRNIWTSIVLHAFNNDLSILLLKFNLADELTTNWIVAMVAAFVAVYIFTNQLNTADDVTKEFS